MSGQEGDLARLYAEHQKFVKEIDAHLHDDPPGDVSDAASAKESALELAIAECPAQTIEGVAIKLRIAVKGMYPEDCDLGLDDKLLLAALADAERLAGGAS